MFVAKNELINAVMLARIRFTGRLKGGMLTLGVGTGIILLATLIPALTMIFRYAEGLNSYQVVDNSGMIFLGWVGALIVFNGKYRSMNQNLAVYPQTNTSRFLAYQVLLHLWIVAIPLFLMMLYLILYGITAAVAAAHDNVHLVYSFDAGFLLSGFAVLMTYLAVLSGIITLISVLLRKFRVYAIVFFSALLILAISNFAQAFNILRIAFGFLLFENSMILFFIKGMGAWAILFVTAVIINKYTDYYKVSSTKQKEEIITGVVVALFLVIVVVISSIFLLTYDTDPGNPNMYEQDSYSIELEFPITSEGGIIEPEHGRIEIDISDLPGGSDIDLIVSGDITLIETYETVISSYHFDDKEILTFDDGSELEVPLGHIVVFRDSLKNIDGNTLIISYSYPHRVVDDMDIGRLLKPELDVRLDGNTLYLSYSFEKNIKAIFLPIWSFMSQFDHFQGKGVVSRFLYSSFSGSPASLDFWIE